MRLVVIRITDRLQLAGNHQQTDKHFRPHLPCVPCRPHPLSDTPTRWPRPHTKPLTDIQVMVVLERRQLPDNGHIFPRFSHLHHHIVTLWETEGTVLESVRRESKNRLLLHLSPLLLAQPVTASRTGRRYLLQGASSCSL